ncbi:hypothetical protein B5V01_07805 [Mesorhizobium erdmanii]|uniref:Uncharacterized protein n=2 Tax=Mesorhizobium TaxID=68287 RepID=A0A3M9X3L5_9HYPH|nr:hypothetical protein DNR46_29110 [Mesorhizobium japonicum]RXT47967.1 hypothetical protein B5V01_07805 [Mesorhizobium erdmanii]
MWQLILSAPFFRSLELAVLDEEGVHALKFPCQRTSTGWKDAVTGVRVFVQPTHWRDWIDPTHERQGGVPQAGARARKALGRCRTAVDEIRAGESPIGALYRCDG